MSKNSFNAKKNLEVAGKSFEIFDISQIDGASSLPYSLKVLLDNLLRTEDGANITANHISALASWDPSVEPDTEIQFTPARVIMQQLKHLRRGDWHLLLDGGGGHGGGSVLLFTPEDLQQGAVV